MTDSNDQAFRPLVEWKRAPLVVEDWLRFAIGAVKAVQSLHECGIIHQDIKPDNLLISPQTYTVKLLGPGLAKKQRQDMASPLSPARIEGTLAYMSPEQTGKLNRPLDYRSDYYSLGVTLYQLLTGQLPFQGSTAGEWIHCHIARIPEAPQALKPDIPAPLSDIVMRLLAKKPEDRYQSAAGLLADLAQCLNEWRETGAIVALEIDRFDASANFHIPERLYGREKESQELLDCFQRVNQQGRPEFVLVTGYAGIGKTALVDSIKSPVQAAGAFFVSGKFDQYHRNVPYSTLVSACAGLVQGLLAQTEEQVRTWRARILEALGSAGQLLVDVLPQLELIIGPQPPLPELPLSEAQNRFHLMFHRFLGVFARLECPLVMFLDDLQWADLASISLLDTLLSTEHQAYLLLVGAHRDNEVSPSHPLMLMLDHVRKNNAVVHTLLLHPLCSKHIRLLLVDTLHMAPEQVQTLADLVYQKTAGNPFFAIRFLQDLHHAGLLWFDQSSHRWQWDNKEIESQGYTDNVIDLMIISFCRMLSTETMEILKLAACIGHCVEQETLGLMANKSPAAIDEAMREAISDGFIRRQNSNYCFVHDRIQQAAYSLIPVLETPALHLRFSRLLLSHLTAVEAENRVFDIVSHFNQCLDLIKDDVEILRVAELERSAGGQAKASAAYGSAAIYFEAGLKLMGEHRWDGHYALMLELTRGLAECKWLSGDFAAAHQQLDVLLAHAGTVMDKATAYQIKGDVYQTEGKVGQAVAITLDSLSLLHIKISAHPGWDQVLAEYASVWEHLGAREIEALLHLPAMTDVNMQIAMGSLSALYAPAYFTDANLATLVACKMVGLTLQFGTHEASAMGYAAFGRMLGPTFGRYQEGYRFGKLGFDLNDQLKLIAYKARIVDLFGISTTFWVHPVSVGLDYAHMAYRSAIEVGDLTYASYACMHIPLFMWVNGEPLEAVQQEAERRIDYVRNAGYYEVADIITCIQRMVACLRGATPSLMTWSDDQFSQAEFEANLKKNRSSFTNSWYQVLKSGFEVFTHQYAVAVVTAQEAGPGLSNTQLLYPEYFYYRALALAANYESVSPTQQSVDWAVLQEYANQLKTWADNNPVNYQNKYALVAAECARIQGHRDTAMRLYDEAIQSAQRHGFIHNEALSCERAAHYYQELGLVTVAEGYLNRALAGYQQWGGWGKVRQLIEQHPALGDRTLAPTTTFVAQPEYFDVLSVSSASQAISREMDSVKLQQSLMRIVIEHSAAEHVRLILVRDHELLLQASGQVKADHIEIHTALGDPLDATLDLPYTVINYTLHSKEKVLLSDAAAHPVFGNDPYVRSRAAKSMLCLPIARGDEWVGLLLLENNLVAGVFSPVKLKILELLAAQAAISLENASLYTNLRKNQSELQSILDNATAVIFTKDLAGRYLLINRQFEQLFKLTKGHVHGEFTLKPDFLSVGWNCLSF